MEKELIMVWDRYMGFVKVNLSNLQFKILNNDYWYKKGYLKRNGKYIWSKKENNDA